MLKKVYDIFFLEKDQPEKEKLNKYSRQGSAGPASQKPSYYARQSSNPQHSMTESFVADPNFGYNNIGTNPSDLVLSDDGEAGKVENEKSNQVTRQVSLRRSSAPPVGAVSDTVEDGGETGRVAAKRSWSSGQLKL